MTFLRLICDTTCEESQVAASTIPADGGHVRRHVGIAGVEDDRRVAPIDIHTHALCDGQGRAATAARAG